MYVTDYLPFLLKLVVWQVNRWFGKSRNIVAFCKRLASLLANKSDTTTAQHYHGSGVVFPFCCYDRSSDASEVHALTVAMLLRLVIRCIRGACSNCGHAVRSVIRCIRGACSNCVHAVTIGSSDASEGHALTVAMP